MGLVVDLQLPRYRSLLKVDADINKLENQKAVSMLISKTIADFLASVASYHLLVALEIIHRVGKNPGS